MASHTVFNYVYNLDHFHTWHTTSMFLPHIQNLCLLSRQHRLIFLPAHLCTLPVAPCQIGDALPISMVMALPCYGKTRRRCQCEDDVIVLLTHDKDIWCCERLRCVHSTEAELWTNTGCDAPLPFLCLKTFCIVSLHRTLVTVRARALSLSHTHIHTHTHTI